MTRDEIVKTILRILESDTGDLEDSADLEDLGWDSLSELELMAIADAEWSIILSPDALTNAKTVGDIVTLVNLKK